MKKGRLEWLKWKEATSDHQLCEQKREDANPRQYILLSVVTCELFPTKLLELPAVPAVRRTPDVPPVLSPNQTNESGCNQSMPRIAGCRQVGFRFTAHGRAQGGFVLKTYHRWKFPKQTTTVLQRSSTTEDSLLVSFIEVFFPSCVLCLVLLKAACACACRLTEAREWWRRRGGHDCVFPCQGIFKTTQFSTPKRYLAFPVKKKKISMTSCLRLVSTMTHCRKGLTDQSSFVSVHFHLQDDDKMRG